MMNKWAKVIQLDYNYINNFCKHFIIYVDFFSASQGVFNLLENHVLSCRCFNCLGKLWLIFKLFKVIQSIKYDNV